MPETKKTRAVVKPGPKTRPKPRPGATAKASPAKEEGALERQGALNKLRAICLALPDTKETLSWGSPHFRVGEKIFSGFGEEKGMGLAIGFKLEMDHADAMIQQPGFWRAPFVGRYGWVSMGVTPKMNWSQVKAFVEESYRLIAPGAKLPGAKRAPKPRRRSKA
jgi:predicted DNA-binding protein (MmcQ/YjbR family)